MEKKIFLKQQANDWAHELGGKPDWLRFETGPICCKCHREMMFYSKLTLPDIELKKKQKINESHYVYVFICHKCNETKSVIH